jgi:hypothetical protein
LKKFKFISSLIALSFILGFTMTSSVHSQSQATTTKVISVVDVYDNAIYLSQLTPGIMIPGQSYGISVTMKNTGLNSWKKGNYSLKLINNTESILKTWSVSSVDVNSTIATGSDIVFNFNVIAPLAEGNYNLQWQMANGNAFFGEPTMNVPINVSGTEVKKIEPDFIENNATFISQNVESEMEEGLTYDVRVTMRNSGSTTWNTGEYKLKVSTKGADNTLNLWKVANVELSNDIYPGSEVTFLFKVTAPFDEGVYNFQCQLVKDDTFFGQPSTNVVVNVD